MAYWQTKYPWPSSQKSSMLPGSWHVVAPPPHSVLPLFSVQEQTLPIQFVPLGFPAQSGEEPQPQSPASHVGPKLFGLPVQSLSPKHSVQKYLPPPVTSFTSQITAHL